MTTSRNHIDASLTEMLDGQSPSTEVLDRAEKSGAVDIQRELGEARAGQDLLQKLTPQPVSAHFERKVQQRVRRRTGGRYYGQATTPFGFGVTIDAFVVLAVAIMAACWFLTQIPPHEVLFTDPPQVPIKPTP
jgi:hypothetical protein